MKTRRLSLSLCCAALLSAGVAQAAPLQSLAQQVSNSASMAATPDPARQLLEAARLFRSNDVVGLAQLLLSDAQFQKARTAYETQRGREPTDAERAEFAEKLAKFTAPDAVDQLMAEIEPKLAEVRPQASGAIMMGLGALQVAVASNNTELSADQREALTRLLPGIQAWATRTDFLSSTTARQALTYVSDAVRGTGVDTLDELRALSFDQALSKAGAVLAAGKRSVALYGIDLDAIAQSMQVQVLSQQGDQARVRITVTVFNTPISGEHDLVLRDGVWSDPAAKHFMVEADAS